MAVFDFIERSSLGSGFIYKNSTEANVYSASTFTATTGSGSSVLTISEVLSGSISVGMELEGLGDSVTILSFGTFDGTSGTVNLSDSTTWSNPTTVTAFGFIPITDPDYPEITVRGIVYLNGTYYVMTPQGSIYGSDLENPFSWSALNVIQTLAEPDRGIALFRQLNLIVAFCDYSIEFFYDASNPVGSPLLPYSSALLELGCASANSISQAENTLFFMGKAKQKGRSIYQMVGVTPEPISNPFVDRLLNADDLEDVTSYCVKIDGHLFYILYLGTIGKTLVYDAVTKLWAEWTQTHLSEEKAVTGATWANRVVTMTIPSHGFGDGNVVVISDVTPAGYNGTYTINTVDANTITYVQPTMLGTFVSGGTAADYVEFPFQMASYTKAGNLDLVQDSTTGTVYSVDTNTYTDNGTPIEFKIRTIKFDGGNNIKKFISQLEIIGDKVTSTAYVRYTNDDYQTYSKYRAVNLETQRSLLNRLGQSRRKAFEIRHHENVPLRLESLELSIKEGTNK